VNRRGFIFNLGAIVACLSFSASRQASAQQAGKPWIVGVMSFAAPLDDPAYAALREALRNLGYMEGGNIKIEFRNAQGHAERLPQLVDELIGLKADVIVVGNPAAAMVLKRATSTIPIVFASSDPIASGLVTNLAHPGGNITGPSTMTSELGAKRLQLLRKH
jgi:putative ABC transport system substrate-binding protein